MFDEKIWMYQSSLFPVRTGNLSTVQKLTADGGISNVELSKALHLAAYYGKFSNSFSNLKR